MAPDRPARVPVRARPRTLLPAAALAAAAAALLVLAPAPVLAAARLPLAPASPGAAAASAITIGPLQAFLVAFGYYLSNSPWLFGLAYFTLFRPLVAGLFVGLILGDPAQGTLVGATINLAYLGFISAGGTLPSDPGLAGWVGTTLALAGRLDPAQALALAVPIGLLGTVIFNLRMTADSVFAHWADARAEAGDIDGVARMNWLPGQAWLFLISVLPVFVLAYQGTDVVLRVLDALPAWVLNGLAVAGGILPAIGIALNMRFIFRGAVVPYFFLGYLVMVASDLKLQIVLVAAIGLVLAYLHVTFVTDARRREVGPSEAAPAGLRPGSEVSAASAGGSAAVAAASASATPTGSDAAPPRLTRGDVLRSWVLWTFFSHANYNYERLQGTGFAHAMTPIIRRLYRTEDEIRAALRRHLVFFNTEPNVGNVIHGAVIAMEEQRAAGAPIDDDAINSVKSGLMGPLAGIGDTISQGTLTPIFLAVGIGIAGASAAAGTSVAGRTGNPLGAAVYLLLIGVSVVLIGYLAWTQGYARGRTFVTDVLRSGAMERLLTGAGVLGNLVLGALAAQAVIVFLAPTVSLYETRLNLQTDILDKLFPGLLPLLLVVGTWYLLRRVSPLRLLALYLAISLVGAFPFFGPGPTNATDFSYSACTAALLHPYTACTPPSPAPAASPSPPPSPLASGAASPAASPSPTSSAAPS
ncbi:MAG TPA: PTS system mannose/fructose/sorbose family transporter subunit IID [Candidatus Limnocylindrales bacterium]